MQFHNDSADLYIPDGKPAADAIARTTHLAIGAHQDDLEIMAYHGIAVCYGRSNRWFGGITCTNGAGSSRTGIYADCTDEDMIEVRRDEQRKAACLGQFSMVAQLDWTSSAAKDPNERGMTEDIAKILAVARPEVVYTHNPADKHPTHIGVLIATLEALRDMPTADRPEKVYGCEVWRNLDWLGDDEKIGLDVSARQNLSASLVGLFDSQISGGKRYDLATAGRWRANATYFDSHGVDEAELMAYAIDLTSVVRESADIVDLTLSAVDRFRAAVKAKLEARLGRS